MDRISQLSDDLLIKILSLVETRDAVAMSILSKRWKSLWTLVPRLIFGDYPEEREDEDETPKTNENHCINMSQFVYGTLLLHKAPVLECFHLNRASGCSASEIDLWVRIAVDRFVRDLTIGFCYEYGLIRLPSRLFRCETLETLELKKVIFLEVPSQISFQSLKTLRLLFVKYANEESFVRLISNSPVLEDLVVETCHDDNVATFTINVPSLESLSISNTLQDLETENDLFVVHYHCLKQFTIVDYFGQLNLIGNMPKLVEANLLSVSCQAKVLQSFTRVKRLSLCLPIEYPYPTGTVLSQLVSLELCLCESDWTNILTSVLQHSPKLQVLKLAMNHLMCEDHKVCWIQPNSVPECLLYHLKTLEWRDYAGTEVEKEVAVYILKNARRLETATIYPDSDKLVQKHQMFEELEIASRKSRAYNRFQTDKFLRLLISVESLSIHLYASMVPLLADRISHRLLRLKLHMYNKIPCNLLLHFLKHSPKLQVLKLHKKRLSHTREIEDQPPSVSAPSSVPECLSFHLETLQWRGYEGTEEEKEVAVYILQNARHLKTASIYIYSEGPRGGENDLITIKELKSISKASTSCQLVIRLDNFS